MEVQVFGTKKSSETRKALRFFSERRIKTHFVDLTERAASLGELRRFAQKFGVERMLDRDSRRFADLGLRQALYSPDYWLGKLADEPLMLRMPLVRNGSKLKIGDAEAEWKAWLMTTCRSSRSTSSAWSSVRPRCSRTSRSPSARANDGASSAAMAR